MSGTTALNGTPAGRTFGSHTLDLVPDALGRVREAKSHVAGSVQETTGYDALGRKTSAKDEVVGLEEALEYQDVLGRLTHRQRWITSGSERLLREEWRTYADAPGAHTVVINETVQTGGDGTRTTRRAVTFDGAGRVTEEKRTVLTEDGAKDAYRRWEYDALGHVRFERWSTTASDVLAAVEQVYDAAGYLVERKEADGTSTKYVTDASGAVAEQVGPHERERWKFVYDALGRQSEKRLVGAGADVPEAVWSYGYGVSGATTEETSPAGYVTRRTLNGRGKVLKEEKKDVGGTRPTSNVLVVDYTYDGPWEKQRTEAEGSWNKTRKQGTIDDRGRVLSAEESWSADGQSYRYATDTTWTGLTAAVTESWSTVSGDRTSAVLADSLGNVVSRTAGGLEDAWKYDAAGKLVSEQRAGKPARTYGYHQDDLATVTYAGEVTSNRYWPSGRLASTTEPSGRKKAYAWYDRGLLKTEEYGVGSDVDRRAYTYDAAGNVATLAKGTESDPTVWQYAHGPRGELLSVTPPSSGAYQYRYDAELRLASVTPPGTDEVGSGSVVQTYDWDYLGRPRGRTRGTSSWTTDWVDGESATAEATWFRTATADQNGDVVKTLLDGRGRRARQRWQPGVASQPYTDLTASVLAYDGLDQLVTAEETRVSGDVTVSYGYDSRSRLTQIDRGAAGAVNYGYQSGTDDRGSVQSPAGTISYGYDGKGRLGTVTSSRGTVTLGWEDGGERLLSASDGALQQCWNHDLRGRVSSVENLPPGAMCNAGAQPYARYEYGYDERGNRNVETYVEGYGLSDETRYGYDRADRLVGVSSLGSGQTKLYGLGGDGTRRCEKTVQGTVPLGSGCDGAEGALEYLAYRYDGAGGLKQLVDGANGQELAAYVTDPAGRLKSEVRGTTTRSYGWDAGGRLAQTTVSTAIAGGGAGVTTLQYGYDWSGRRVSRTSSDLTTAYLWGDGELVEERLPGRTVLYENGAGMALAAGGERLMYDALGSAVGRVGASGTPALYRYDAWGGYRGSAPGSSDPSAGYAGQHWDGDAGLSYAQQRWYDPRSGRFLSEDPVFGDVQQPNSLHAFGYANGNPLAFTDPSGELGIKPINEADSTRQMDYWWNIYHNAPDGSPQRADALQKYQFWKNEAQDARENIILNEEVVFPLAVDVLAAEVVGPFAKAYRAVRWGLGALSAARGAARLKKAAGEKGTQRTADLIGGAGELAGGGLMFTPELVRVPGAIKQKLSGLGGEQGVKTAPADLAPAPRSLGAAAADDPGLATDESGTLLYRSMKPDTSGGPKIGPSARTLGVRPGAQGDIPVEGDVVKPNTGGMSVTPDDPMGLPSFRRPPGMGGTGKDPVYCISEECLGQSLRYRPDPHRPNEHGFIEPSKPMTLEDFQKALADTVRSWKKVE